VGSHEHNLLPFGTPQSYPLLSAQSKAVSAANNKEMLAECHDIMFCRTIERLTRSGLRYKKALHFENNTIPGQNLVTRSLKI
jgi:hypothetical protein